MKKTSVKVNNQKRVLDFLRNGEILSIADIAQTVQISKTTVKKIVDYYLEIGIVNEVGKGDSTEEGGKKPSLFQINKEYGSIIAVHLGPDFCFGAVTDLHGDIVNSFFNTLEKKEFKYVLSSLSTIINDLIGLVDEKKTKILEISLAFPGVVNVDTGVAIFSPHYVDWGTNIPIIDFLKEKISEDLPISIENVNRLQAFAEGVKGKAVGKKNFVIIDAIYEGLGAGIVFNGNLWEGVEYLSGEIGHMVLKPDDGPACICGGKGCFEALVSMNRLNAKLNEYFAEKRESLIFRDYSPDHVNIDSLFEAFLKNDDLAVEIITDIVKWFAIGINNVIMVYDPEMIILQGLYSAAGPQFLDMLKKKIDQMSLPYLNRKVEIVFSDIGRERGVLGAAAYSLYHYFNRHSF